MKRFISTALLATAILLAGCGAPPKHHDEKKIKTISIRHAPAAVVNETYREYPGSRITRIERDITTTPPHYIVYFRTPDGMNREVIFDSNGINLSR